MLFIDHWFLINSEKCVYYSHGMYNLYTCITTSSALAPLALLLVFDGRCALIGAGATEVDMGITLCSANRL